MQIWAIWRNAAQGTWVLSGCESPPQAPAAAPSHGMAEGRGHSGKQACGLTTVPPAAFVFHPNG